MRSTSAKSLERAGNETDIDRVFFGHDELGVFGGKGPTLLRAPV
jgi:hypothetical protein